MCTPGRVIEIVETVHGIYIIYSLETHVRRMFFTDMMGLDGSDF